MAKYNWRKHKKITDLLRQERQWRQEYLCDFAGPQEGRDRNGNYYSSAVLQEARRNFSDIRQERQAVFIERPVPISIGGINIGEGIEPPLSNVYRREMQFESPVGEDIRPGDLVYRDDNGEIRPLTTNVACGDDISRAYGFVTSISYSAEDGGGSARVAVEMCNERS